MPTPRQRNALEQLFPGAELRIDTRTFTGADEVIHRLRILGGDELVIVAPLHVIRAICQRGVQPLWAEMATTSPSDPLAEVHIADRHYKFVKFWRVLDVRLELADIVPSSTQPKGD